MKSGSPSRTTAAHKTQTKIQAWSSLVFHCRHSSFNPSEAPPWDSRPVSGAGVVHYHLLHRPRSVPTALGPAPLATVSIRLLFKYFLLISNISPVWCIYIYGKCIVCVKCYFDFLNIYYINLNASLMTALR